MVTIFENCHKGGITQLKFSNSGYFLFSGARKDDNIHCWDLRFSNQTLYSIKRKVNTNQRILFDIDNYSNYLISPSIDGNGNVSLVYNVNDGSLVHEFDLLNGVNQNCINSTIFHPFLPLLAVSTGERSFIYENFDYNTYNVNDLNSIYLFQLNFSNFQNDDNIKDDNIQNDQNINIQNDNINNTQNNDIIQNHQNIQIQNDQNINIQNYNNNTQNDDNIQIE
jgi:hypothetical protein